MTIINLEPIKQAQEDYNKSKKHFKYEHLALTFGILT